MSTKGKNLTELLQDLEHKGEKADLYEKAFNGLCKAIFGYSMEQIYTIIRKQEAYERQKQLRAQQGQQGPDHS